MTRILLIKKKGEAMSEVKKCSVQTDSLRNLHQMISTLRDHDGFGSFELFDSVDVALDNNEIVTFPSGSRASYYGKHAVILTCLTSSYDSLLVKTDGSAEVSHHDLTDPSHFNTWMNSMWELERPPKP